ncbi:hypothetical protein [Agrococcus sp. Marseille-P2731]|uniref:hypothetical protein n=1 Tax=Agrococcus sp. Marseille-P2731 TaxID=1841862 RepID=UPI00092FE3A7|nr:hypothetical protein [Agrococcus sp. Marseille-P2731]
MAAALRMAGAILALGSALIALAVGAGSVPWLGAPLLAAGVGQAVAAVLVLRGRSASPLLALLALIAPTAVWVGVLALAAEPATALPAWPMLAETALALVAAPILCRRARSSAEPRPLPALLALVLSSAVVAVVATMAFAGTEAGRFAVPHGEHGLTIEDHGHH